MGRHVPVFILVLFVDAAHEGGCRREDFVDEDEDGLLRRQLDALSDDIDELAYGEICGDQVLLLINSSDVGLFHLLADNLWDGKESRLARDRRHKATPTMPEAECRRENVWKRRHTGIRSEYFCRMRSASALRFSKGCSSLNLLRILAVGWSR